MFDNGSIGIGTTSPITKLDVRGGYITAGTGTSTSGTVIIGGYYSDGNLTVLGTEYSSGGPMLGYGVTPSTASAGSFFSSTGINVYRSAYIQDGGTHRWYTGAVQTVAIGSAVSISEKMRMDVSGQIGIGTSTPRQILHLNGSVLLDGIQNGYEQGSTRGIGYGSNSGAVNTDGFSGMDIQSVNAPAPNGGNYSQNVRFWAHHYGTGTGGTPRMVIQYNGNVGIGTTSPIAKLHVVGNVQLSGSLGASLNINTPGSGNGDISFDGSTFTIVSNSSSAPIVLSTNSTERFRIISNGNVGIGTSTVSRKIHAYVDTGPVMRLQSSGSNASIEFIPSSGHNRYNWLIGAQQNVSDAFEITPSTATNGTTFSTPSLLVKSDGNVGISTTAPASKFEVFGGDMSLKMTGVTTGSILFKNSSGTKIQEIRYDDSDGSMTLGGVGGYPIKFITSTTEKVRIAGDGNLGIGTTNPNAKLDINGTVRIVNTLRIDGFDTSGSQRAIGFGGNTLGTNGVIYSNGSYIAISAATGQPVYINSDTGGNILMNGAGNVGIGTSTVGTKFVVNGGTVNTSTYTSSESRISDGSIHLMKTVVGGVFESMRAMNADTTAGTTVRFIAASTSDPFNNTNGGKVFIDAIRTSTNMDLAFSLNDVAGAAPVERVRFMGNGNVGIGTTNPVAKLSVYTTSPHASPTGISVAAGAGGANLLARDSGNYHNWFPYTDGLNYYSADGHVFRSSNHLTNYVNINSNGNVGIGTSSPLGKLHVIETTATGSRIQLGTNSENALMDANKTVDMLILNAPYGTNSATTSNAGAKWGIKFVGSLEAGQINTIGKTSAIYAVSEDTTAGYNRGTSLAFYTNQLIDIPYAERMRISHNGNVGIGTTSPAYKLDVGGTARVGDTFLITTATTADARLEIGSGRSGNGNSYLDLVGDATYTDYGLRLIRYDSGANSNSRLEHKGTGQLQLFVSETGSLTISTNSSERVRVDNSGNVGIGTSSPATKLDVKGNVFVANAADGNNTIAFGNIGGLGPLNGAPDNLTGSAFLVVSSSTASGAPSHMKFYTTTAGVCGERMRIINDGNVGIGTTAPAYKLEVNGSFAASTKSFKIDHPIKSGKKLVYGSLESPYHGIRLTGKDTLVGGKCVVKLPDYICKLVRSESVTIQLTGIKCGKILYIDEINVPENYFIVVYDKTMLEFNKTYEFFWDFTATRSDVPELITEV